ncbi:hypothetical protein LDG_8599 [Legionella drancourtii LLAP12]|uniref:Uncharacterized protein n=1 Tax=Legionella drancourtii LLAP12 TaxID=658187 RepID=G9ETG7_9GAMM|nr:hypothetical protein LDG_8599 [Legionella drancourtii LLAP12]
MSFTNEYLIWHERNRHQAKNFMFQIPHRPAHTAIKLAL